jgi:hypothetical protein
MQWIECKPVLHITAMFNCGGVAMPDALGVAENEGVGRGELSIVAAEFTVK